MKHKTINVYDWDDIEEAICEEMGIDRKYFRDYGEVVGGGYKDLWHIALKSVIPDNMTSGTIVELFNCDWNKEHFLAEFGDWTGPFLDAYNVVMQKIDPKDDGAHVSFFW